MRSQEQINRIERLLADNPDLRITAFVPPADFALVALNGTLRVIDQQREFDTIELGQMPAHLLRSSAIRMSAQQIRNQSV
jgi:hypothetical protein